MGNIVKFSAVNSKIKTLKGKMLKNDQYYQLLHSKGFKDVLTILKENTHYSEALKNYDTDKINRGELEIILYRHYVSIHNKFINYFNGEHRKFIKNLFIKWEIEDLKIIIRGKYIGRTKEDIERLLVARSPLSTLDYTYLIASKDLSSLIERLKGTIYYNGIKNLIKDIDINGLFRVETELDFVYFSNIRKELKHLDKENRMVINEIIGLEGDLLNLSWIYRGKKFFNISSEELFNYTIYDGFKLSKENIKRLCYVKNGEEFHDIIRNTNYEYIYEKDEPKTIEKREREYEKKYYGKYLKENKQNFGILMSYLNLYRIEIRDIVSIAEQKRYYGDSDSDMHYVSVTL